LGKIWVWTLLLTHLSFMEEEKEEN
jgi:hypothetical protein